MKAGKITEFPIPTYFSQPIDITQGPDGAFWFTERIGIGRITTEVTITEFDLPSADSSPAGITQGPDRALWFTEYDGGKVGRITTKGHKITEFPLPTFNAGPWGITKGPDGTLWFTENKYPGNIGRIYV